MSKSALTFDKSGKAFSYATIILDILPDGRTVGNVTKYSVTTSKHQTQARVRGADILVDGVPMGTRSLARFVPAAA